jgi:hypothetical protein
MARSASGRLIPMFMVSVPRTGGRLTTKLELSRLGASSYREGDLHLSVLRRKQPSFSSGKSPGLEGGQNISQAVSPSPASNRVA